ncbi:MAG: tetratricopeptide repeat protein [Alphaproteobacteria bacterium]|nr:tetratricopeptide repeat protein [Alphaproteobacteria bacterium]
MEHDIRRNPLTGANAAAAASYAEGLLRVNLFIGDPVASADAAIAEAPNFTMAHALRAWLFLLSTEAQARTEAHASWKVARDLPMTAQEAGHIAAIGHLLSGQWHRAARVLEDVTITHPHDLLALQVGHQLDFFTGNARMLRDRIARARPAWSPETPGWHTLLGMHAFGLEEMGDYAAAEAAGREAVGIERRDAWAQHAVAHVLEMQGRTEDGIAWMTADSAAWSEDNFFAVHNWWHVALYHLETGDIAEVLRLFDGPIYGARSPIMIDMLDAAALLWRLRLRNTDVGDRWQPLAEAFATAAGAGNYAFNDLHATMAFVGAGHRDLVNQVLAAQDEAMGRDDDNAGFTREVGNAATRAIIAFGAERYDEAVTLLRPVRGIANRFGGSHAQRDVLDLTLIEAALRAGQHDLARALAAERLAAKPDSPLANLFARRAAAGLAQEGRPV